MLHPTSMKPHLVYNSVKDIPFETLKSGGFEFVVFDKDNTLTDHEKIEVKHDLTDSLLHAQKVFGKSNVALFSNNLKSDRIVYKGQPGHGNVLQFINSEKSHKKPFCEEEILRFLRVDKKEGNKVVIIGDRLLTDMVLANRIGGLGILVLPWDLESEQPGIQASRRFESFIWSSLFSNSIKKHPNPAVQKLAEGLDRRG